MDKCINPELGSLLSSYQLGSLSKKNQIRFEEHLLECNYCSEELKEMSELASNLRENKNEILTALNAAGLNLTGLKKEVLKEISDENKSVYLNVVWERLKNVFSLPKVYVPVSVMVSIVLFTIVFRLSQPLNPYIDILRFDNNSENILILRDYPSSEGEKLYQMGINAYLKGDLEAAIPLFKETVELLPQEFDAWFYLGVSYYLNKKGKPAIKCLKQALNLNPHSEITNLYLAEAYLLSNLPDEAVPLLRSLQMKESLYSRRATDYLKEIENIQNKGD